MFRKRKKWPRYLGGLLFLLVLFGLSLFLYRRHHWLPTTHAGNGQMEFPAKDSLVFFALGDTGTGDSMQYATAQAMEERCQKLGGIDGILLLGDNFYKVGVQSVDDPQWQDKMELPLGSPCLKQAPIFPIFGNHDYRGSTDAQIAYTLRSERWKMPFRFYEADFGRLLRINAFDSAFPDFCLVASSCAVDHLLAATKDAATKDAATKDAASNANAKRWQLIIAHNPLASASTHGHGHKGGIFGRLMAPLLCSSADAYLSGHAHHLEHRELPGCPMDLYISGAGGADLYEIASHDPATKFAASVYGFLELTVTYAQLTTAFISQQGEVLYSHEKTKP